MKTINTAIKVSGGWRLRKENAESETYTTWQELTAAHVADLEAWKNASDVCEALENSPVAWTT